MSSMSDLQFAREILSTRKNCNNCWFRMDKHCSLASVRCATDILNKKDEPSRWLSYEEGEGYDTQAK